MERQGAQKDGGLRLKKEFPRLGPRDGVLTVTYPHRFLLVRHERRGEDEVEIREIRPFIGRINYFLIISLLST